MAKKKPSTVNTVSYTHLDVYKRQAQGMSSSLIYFLVVRIKDQFVWWILVILIYLINILLAVLIAEGLKKIDTFGWKILEYLRKKTASIT